MSLTFSLHQFLSSIALRHSHYILCPYRVDLGKLFLVGQNWNIKVYGFVERRHLWLYSCFSITITHLIFVLLWWVYFFYMGEKLLHSDCFVGAASIIYSTEIVAFITSSHLAISLRVLLATMWWIYTIVLTQTHLGRNPILFYSIDQTSIWSILYC